MKNVKLLIASGCSYAAGPENWPNPTAEILNCSLTNHGTVSVGNGRISRSIIYGVTDALKRFDPEDIVVGISWSGNCRREAIVPLGLYAEASPHPCRWVLRVVDPRRRAEAALLHRSTRWRSHVARWTVGAVAWTE